MANQSWGQIRYGRNTPASKAALTPEQRDALVNEARQLREADPGISRYAIGQALAAKYGVTSSYIRNIID